MRLLLSKGVATVGRLFQVATIRDKDRGDAAESLPAGELGLPSRRGGKNQLKGLFSSVGVHITSLLLVTTQRSAGNRVCAIRSSSLCLTLEPVWSNDIAQTSSDINK
jgi:hypothetical protein